jgi:hypothetical protein
LRQTFAALHEAWSLYSTGHPARGGIPFPSRLIFHFSTEYNARRRRASGMLVASFEADIMRKSGGDCLSSDAYNLPKNPCCALRISLFFGPPSWLVPHLFVEDQHEKGFHFDISHRGFRDCGSRR